MAWWEEPRATRFDVSACLAPGAYRLVGESDKEARTALGYVEFAHEIPEEIALRRYTYVRAVEHASEQRWFDPRYAKDELELANRAWDVTRDHAQRLVSDPKFR